MCVRAVIINRACNNKKRVLIRLINIKTPVYVLWRAGNRRQRSSENRFYLFLDGTRGTLWSATTKIKIKSIKMIPPLIMVLSLVETLVKKKSDQ